MIFTSFFFETCQKCEKIFFSSKKLCFGGQNRLFLTSIGMWRTPKKGGSGPDLLSGPPPDPPFWPGGQETARCRLLSTALKIPISFSRFFPFTCYPLPRVLFASGGGPPKMTVSGHFLASRGQKVGHFEGSKMITFRSFFCNTSFHTFANKNSMKKSIFVNFFEKFFIFKKFFNFFEKIFIFQKFFNFSMILSKIL